MQLRNWVSMNNILMYEYDDGRSFKTKPAYKSSYNKLVKIHDGITIKCSEIFELESTDTLEECDTDLLIWKINNELKNAVYNKLKEAQPKIIDINYIEHFGKFI